MNEWIMMHVIVIVFIKKLIFCLYKALDDTIRHDGIEHAGYMAFLSLLSLFPFLVFLIALAGFIGELEIGEEFVALFMANLPVHVRHALSPRIQEITSGPPQGLLTLAIVGAIWTASSAVEGLRTILNRVYRVTTPPPYLWRRLLSIFQFLLLTGFILFAMMLLILMPLIWERIAELFFLNYQGLVWESLRYTIAGGILFIGISSIYYLVPNIQISWWQVVPGALLVVLVWLVTGTIFSFYLSHFQQLNLIYGSLGGIIVSLLFFYIMNMIFIYGAEFNYIFWQQFAQK